jgi:hypothetical protein
VTKLHPADLRTAGKPKLKGHKHVLGKMRDAERLLIDIKANGLKNPLTFYKHRRDRRLAIIRGGRRLVILHALGIDVTPVRVFQSLKDVRMYDPIPDQWQNVSVSTHKQLPTIHELAMEQFQQLKGRSTDKYWVHGYTTIYDKLWDNAYRHNRLKILELGLLRGASLRLWHEAFPNAMIYGVDKNYNSWKKYTRGLDRVEVWVGNEQDRDFMNQVAAKGPFDIIVDDCGHHPQLQADAFEYLWPAVRRHGYYVIEDCHHSFNSEYKGPNFVTSIVQRVTELYTDYSLESAQFWYNLCVLQKGITG